MRNIFEEIKKERELIRILRKAKSDGPIGNPAVVNILAAKEGSNYMSTTVGNDMDVGNIDKIMREVTEKYEPNTKITGVILFMDKK